MGLKENFIKDTQKFYLVETNLGTTLANSNEIGFIKAQEQVEWCHEIPKEVLDKFKESRLVPLRTIAGENTNFEIKVPTIEEEMEKHKNHPVPV